ncbi:probable 5-hydroxyisourate hydrolase ZK697.8 [Fopius arisanus]|uniref:5-hydroxyisourate hydrolase n=1 Tax=Fopius arisanus TaxID=64838 RepID=A0A9R1TUD0_9HYME|nr:PREDICTED: probable 5-hydroxyisourate hydrolase ZK697.8 [Fopius arisanus]
MNKPHISTHILDTSLGNPVPDVSIKLYKYYKTTWSFISESKTLSNGRCEDLLQVANETLTADRYKLVFEVKKYFDSTNTNSLYPEIDVIIEIKNADQNYHLPLLLNPYGYSTYRGS